MFTYRGAESTRASRDAALCVPPRYVQARILIAATRIRDYFGAPGVAAYSIVTERHGDRSVANGSQMGRASSAWPSDDPWSSNKP
jgi:hypothetical protein